MRLLKAALPVLAAGLFLVACTYTPKEEAAAPSPEPTAPPTAAPAADPSPSPDPTEEPALDPLAGLSADNPLRKLTLVTVPLLSGNGQMVGERAYILADSSIFTDMVSAEQFREFVDAVAADSSYNWITVDLNDGTGMQLIGNILIDYGYIDEEGRITESLETYGLEEDGHYHPFSEDGGGE